MSNKLGYTVAIYLIKNNIKVPNEWKYDPTFRLYNKNTTAMILSEKEIDFSEEWDHDPSL